MAFEALPVEVISLIAHLVAPANRDKLLHPASEASRTLLALTRTSRKLYFATRHLFFRHCIYVEDAARARRLMHCLDHSPPPFLNDVEQGGMDTSLRRVSSLYIRPFKRYSPNIASEYPEEDIETARTVQTILDSIAPTLARLVLDMHIWDLGYFHEHNYDGDHIRRTISQAVYSLRNLREFACVDQFFFHTHIAPWNYPRQSWHNAWPNLRRLALYDAALQYVQEQRAVENFHELWLELAGLRCLETLVVAEMPCMEMLSFDDFEADEERPEISDWPDFAVMWWKALDAAKRRREECSPGWQGLSERTAGPLQIVVAEYHSVPDRIMNASAELEQVAKAHKGDKVVVYKKSGTEVDGRLLDGPENEGYNGVYETLQMMKGRAIEGVLFETNGLEYKEFGEGL